jgi:hypothetical protein
VGPGGLNPDPKQLTDLLASLLIKQDRREEAERLRRFGLNRTGLPPEARRLLNVKRGWTRKLRHGWRSAGTRRCGSGIGDEDTHIDTCRFLFAAGARVRVYGCDLAWRDFADQGAA